MKVNSLILVILFPAFLGFSPNNNTLLDGKSKRVGKRSAVEVNFALVNKQGQPSQVFREGEDIIFSLTLQNNTGDSLYLDNSFLTDGNGFCTVYTYDNKMVGKPFSYSSVQIVSSDAHPFFGDQREYTLRIPWNDNRPFWSTLHHTFRGMKQKGLPKGKYYTVFKHRFCFDRTAERPSLCLAPVDIRIDFEVM
jgi:hypothetical protein